MRHSEPPRPRKPGKAAGLILIVVAAIILLLFVARNVWHGERLEEDQQAGNNVAANYQGQSNY